MSAKASPNIAASSAAAKVPLYYWIEQELRVRIESAEFEAGASLPTEDHEIGKAPRSRGH